MLFLKPYLTKPVRLQYSAAWHSLFTKKISSALSGPAIAVLLTYPTPLSVCGSQMKVASSIAANKSRICAARLTRCCKKICWCHGARCSKMYCSAPNYKKEIWRRHATTRWNVSTPLTLRFFKNASSRMLMGGIRQRVALIRTLINDLDITLLDQPLRRLLFRDVCTLEASCWKR